MSLAGFLYRRDYGERRTTMGTVTAEPACNSVENYDLGFPEESELHYFEVSLPKANDNYTYLFLKRTFDAVVSAVLIVLLALPMLFIAILIRLDSPGPALFRQERLGKDGQPFTILKFRSMRLDAEENGPQWADKDDPRCTHLGRGLRKSRLDELPQLWNILKGDMSFVGPRPERKCFY